MPLPAVGFVTAIVLLYITGRTIDDLERRLVAGLVILAPGTHSVMTEQNAAGLRVLFDQLFDLQTDVEVRPLPRDVDQFVTINLLAQSFLVNRGSDRDDRVRVQMIYMLIRNERVQWRVDRASARVEVEDTMAVHVIYRVLDWRRWPPLGTLQIERLHRS